MLYTKANYHTGAILLELEHFSITLRNKIRDSLSAVASHFISRSHRDISIIHSARIQGEATLV